MALNNINLGTAANNGTGEEIRSGGGKINANFAFLDSNKTDKGNYSGTAGDLKTYVDTMLQGLKWKDSVLVATTANIALTGEQTIDGVLTATSRVLVKEQTTKTENGIYLTGAGAWTRTTDADANTELTSATVSIEQGTTLAGDIFTCNTSPITLGTTDIEFVSVSKGTVVTDHNALSGKQGGTSGEYNHLTNAELAKLQAAPATSEAAFNKNSAFNKNFGTVADTVAQGDDSRIVNGQAAFDGLASKETPAGAQAKADAKVEDQIVDGVLDKAPSQNAVFDALALKVDDSQVLTDVPAGALFTDTVYNDTAIQADVDSKVKKRTIKPLPNTAQYTLIAADFTDFILKFTANANEEISIVLNAGVAPLNGELQMISTGNNKLVPSLTGVTATYPEQTNPKTILKGWLGGIVTATDTISFNGSLESTATSGIADAPSDGTAYNRKDAAWVTATGTTYNPFTNTVDGLVPAPNVGGTTYSGAITSPTEGFTATEGQVTSVTLTLPAGVASSSDLEIVTSDFTGGTPWKKLKDLLKEHEINGTRITASVSGTYALDWNAASVFDLTMTANTTFSSVNLPTGTNTKIIEMLLTGAFTPTFPATWVEMPGSIDYAGAKINRYQVDCINGTGGSEKIYYDNRTTT